MFCQQRAKRIVSREVRHGKNMKWLQILTTTILFPTMVVLASGEEITADSTNQAYVVKSGDTLQGIAQQRYGNPHYWAVLRIYNDIEEDTRLRPKQVIKTPDLKTLLTKEGLVPMMEREVDAVLKVRSVFREAEGRLLEVRRGKKSPHVDIPDDLKATLNAAVGSVDVAINGLKEKKHGVGAIPGKMIGQQDGSLVDCCNGSVSTSNGQL